MRLICVACVTVLASVHATAADNGLSLNLRSQNLTAPNSGRYHTTTTPATWPANQTALIVCDMWDKHWCKESERRVGQMVERANAFVAAARRRGVFIIHCPSDTLEFYKDHPGRKLAMAAPKVEPKVPLQRWCKLVAAKEGPLPIDDTDGGCDTPTITERVWTRQHPTIVIEPGDAITDSEEAYYLLRQRDIRNVMVLGVHTNFCVLGRPFGIRQLCQQGLTVALVRDLTDSMYNPAKAPMVSHFTGTDFVVDHIEQHWCPTILSSDLLGGKEYRFPADTRPTIVVVAAEDEYRTEDTLRTFAREQLGKQYRVRFVFADAKNKHHLPGLDQLAGADAIMLSVRRKPLLNAELEQIRAFIGAGKPVIALRTSSHAFAPRKGDALPLGVAAWEGFDTEILGCAYAGHYSNKVPTRVTVAVGNAIVNGLKPEPVAMRSWLYKSKPLAADCVVLAMGQSGENPPEPVAWVRQMTTTRGRVFYCSLGHPDDFREPLFTELLARSVAWAVASP